MNVEFHRSPGVDFLDEPGSDDYDEYGSDGDNSSMDSFDLAQEAAGIPDQKKQFETRFRNRQIETLKYLRHALKENKSLKTRLTIVESELERYQLFKAISPLKPSKNQPSQHSDSAASFHAPPEERAAASSTVPAASARKASEQHEKSTSAMNLLVPGDTASKTTPAGMVSVSVATEPSRETDKAENVRGSVSKYVQTAEAASLSARPSIVKETALQRSEPAPPPPVLKVTHEVQADLPSIRELETRLDEMTKQTSESRVQHEEKVKALEEANLGLKQKCEKLNETVQTLHKNNDVTNEKLAELSKANLKLSDDMKKQNELKETVNLLRVENEQIYLELQSKEGELNMRREEIGQLSKLLEKFNDTLKAYEEQKIIIGNLKAENDKHLKEKHLICQQKINELSQECRAAKDTVEAQRGELDKAHQLNKDLTRHIDKLKLEQQNFNFKEFIAIKRELTALKQERERNFVAAATASSAAIVPVPNPLPPLKEPKKNIFNFFND